MTFLSSKEQEELKALRLKEPFVDQALRQLDRILGSQKFERVQQKTKDFLGYGVAKKLLGREGEIKELMIAMTVYGDKNYDPKESTKIRVAGMDLRQRLVEYYAGEGQTDPIKIELPERGYVPVIQERWPSLTVSLFQNWNPSGDQDYLCATVQNEIVNRLSHAGGVRVTPLTRGEAEDHHSRYGLRGSLECLDAVLRLNVSICDYHAGRVIFSRAFEAKRDDLLKLAGEVAQATLDVLQPQNDGDHGPRIKESPERFEALQLYQEGRAHLRRRTATDIRKAIDFFQRAIDANGQYARAYAGLADCHLLISSYELSTPDRVWFEAGKAYALKALALNPRLPEVRASLGYAKLLCDFDWPGAEEEFRQAILFDNRYAQAHQWYANLLVMQGRFAEAEEELKRAFHLDPGSMVIRETVGDPYYYSRRYERAIDSYRSALKIDPSFWMSHLFLGWSYEQVGERARALQEFEAVTARDGVSSILQGALGHLYATTGRKLEALSIIDRLKGQEGAPYVAPHTLAVIYAGLGEKDQAFEWLNASYENRIELLGWIKVDPRFDALHGDARFDRFLEKVGLPC